MNCRTPWGEWALAAAVGLAGLAALAGLEHLGRNSRRVGEAAAVTGGTVEVVLAGSGAEVLQEWRRRGFKGRTVIHVGRYLHFIEPNDAEHLAFELLTGTGQGAALVEALAVRARSENYLWTAAETGVARKVLYVSPEESLRRRAAALGVDPFDGVLDLESGGFKREATAHVPRSDEPVLLDIAASYFDEGDGEALFHMLEASGLRADLVTLDLLDGNDDVTDTARNRLRAFRLAIARERR